MCDLGSTWPFWALVAVFLTAAHIATVWWNYRLHEQALENIIHGEEVSDV